MPLLWNAENQQTYFFSWQTIAFSSLAKTPWLLYILSVIVISLNAHQLNNVFNRNTFFSKDTFLPGFIYVTGLTTFESLGFSPLLLAHLFFIAGISFLLQMKRQEPAKTLLFAGSLLISLGIVFSPLLISLALLPWLSLMIIRPFIWREWIIAALGLALPVFYHYVIYFVATGSVSIQQMEVQLYEESTAWTLLDGATYASMAVCTCLGLLKFFGVMRSQLVNFKKISQVILITVLLSAVGFILGYYVFSQMYLSFLIPLGIIISVQLLYTERPALMGGFVMIWFVFATVHVFMG